MLFSSIAVIAFVFLVGLCDGSKVNYDLHLYNLTDDPNETTDIYDASDAGQVELIDFLKERVDYWSQFYVPIESEGSGDRSAFVAAGGYSSWETSDFVPIQIEQKFSFSDAPHIVYVLVDDWGWNDLGSRSTYLSWTTPTIDSLADQGVSLSNYYTNELCAPSRASLMTGRYAFRLGFQSGEEGQEMSTKFLLNVSEVTLAQELQSAGYRTYLVGKWDLGYETIQNCPNDRGFDYFYGYYNTQIDYYSKKYNNYLDLHENEEIVTSEAEISSDLHAVYLFQDKVEYVIKNHSEIYSGQPMFLYYAMQLIHDPFEVPDSYLGRCGDVSSKEVDDATASDLKSYCGMNLMLDEAIANLTCTLKEYGMDENLIFVIASDNGGTSKIQGDNYPYRGSKAFYTRGGISSTAIVVSNLIDSSVRGTSYSGVMHITDWLPTLMNPATEGKWEGGYLGQIIDGIDLWKSLTTGVDSGRVETVHLIGNATGGQAVILYDNIKLMYGVLLPVAEEPLFSFTEDQDTEASTTICSNTVLYESAADSHNNPIIKSIVSTDSDKKQSALGRTADIAISTIGLIMFFGLTALFCVFQASVRNRNGDPKKFDAERQHYSEQSSPEEIIPLKSTDN